MPSPTITHTVSVYRFQRSGSSDSYDPTPIYTGVDISAIPAGIEILAVFGSGPNLALYEIFTTENVTLQTGDKLTDGTDTFIVRGAPQIVHNPLMQYVRVIGEVPA